MRRLDDVPILYMMAGLPGAGKTTFARHAAEKIGAVHLNSVLMRRVMGLPLDHDPNSKERTKDDLHLFGTMDTLALSALCARRDVLYDASHNTWCVREKGRDLAGKIGGTAVLVWVDTPLAVALNRVSMRSENGMTSNPPREIIEAYALEAPAPDELHIIIDGSLPTEDQLSSFNQARNAMYSSSSREQPPRTCRISH